MLKGFAIRSLIPFGPLCFGKKKKQKKNILSEMGVWMLYCLLTKKSTPKKIKNQFQISKNKKSIPNFKKKKRPYWVISTIASVIASQALISGVFSTVKQAVSLG